ASKQSTSRGRSKSPVANGPTIKKAKKDTMEEETASQQQLLNQQQVPQPQMFYLHLNLWTQNLFLQLTTPQKKKERTQKLF
ncbi:10787_t:CDS:1, partial [Funneliformis geosporum]